MTTNEKIARWLGLETFNAPLEDNILVVYKDNKRITLDFAGDRNQQKWIIDELKKRGYTIAVVTDKEGTNVTIYREKECPDGIMYDYNETTSRKEEGEVLIEAVLELIEKK
jgi:hypothetical protein